MGITEALAALVFLPLIIGATFGSLYFIVNNNKSHKWWVLIVLALISWVFGYALGMPLAQTAYAMFVSLVGSAVAIVLLDSTTNNIENDKEAPKILTWVVDLIKSIRG